MLSSNQRQALKICLIYAISTAVWILLSDLLIGRWIDNRALQTDLSILKGWFFVLLTSILLYFLTLRFTQRWTEAAEEQRKAAEELKTSARALRTISECNRALVRVTSEPALLNEICRVLVDQGGFRMAWVGFAEKDGQKSVNRAAAAGFEDGYLENARITWDERDPNGQGPTGIAIRSGQISICQDIRTDPKLLPWREAAIQRGYAASITLPLTSGGETFGVLILYSAQAHSFNHTEIQLLSQLADDLAFGVQSLRTREARRRAETALRESEEQFRAMAEGLPQLVWMCRPDGAFVYFNQRWVNYTGLTLDESYGDGWRKPFHPDDQPRVQAAWQRAFQLNEPFSVESRLQRLDGSYRWWLIQAKPLHDANAVVLKWFGTCTDIEELKNAELVQAHLAAIVEFSSDAIVSRDLAGIITSWNAGAERLFGYTAAEMIGSSVLRLIPPSLAASEGQIEQRLSKGEHVDEFETVRITKDGRHLPVSIVASPIKDKAGKIIGISRTARDISQLKLHQERIELQLSALEAAANAIVITDFKGVIEWVNPAFSQMTGYPREEAIGQNPRVLSSGQNSPAFFATMWGTILTGNPWHGQLVNRRKDGSLYTEEMTITPVRGVDGQVAHFVAIKQDITQKLLFEKQLQQSQKMEAIGTLAGGIAHDFNNILAAMVGYAHLLRQDTADNPAAQEEVTEMVVAMDRAKELVLQILTFCRQKERKPEIIKLDKVVKEAMRFLRASMSAQIAMELKLSEQAPAILADPTQIYQVVVNLATNSLYAMEGRQGRLIASLDPFQPDERFLHNHPAIKRINYARLTMTDTGQGMDAKTLERIFEPFFTTKPAGMGTGLGLALVHGIVQSHSGVIMVQSQLGQGTTFQIYFPAQAQATPRDIPPETELPAGQGQQILLVDDEVAITNTLSRILTRLKYVVTAKNCGQEALALIQQDPARFQLLLSDLTMPGMSGLDLARQAHSLCPELPIILASGYPSEVSADVQSGAGVTELLQKPLSMRILAETVARQLKS